MKNTLEKYLPIGTVCLLKDSKKRVMIIGFCGYSNDKEEDGKVYDYIGCVYPEGFISSNINLLFNHEQIETIYSLGYFDEEEYQFKQNLKNELDSIIKDGKLVNENGALPSTKEKSNSTEEIIEDI